MMSLIMMLLCNNFCVFRVSK